MILADLPEHMLSPEDKDLYGGYLVGESIGPAVRERSLEEHAACFGVILPERPDCNELMARMIDAMKDAHKALGKYLVRPEAYDKLDVLLKLLDGSE